MSDLIWFDVLIKVLLPIFSLLVGYSIGNRKVFFEKKQQTYDEILPILIKAKFEMKKIDQDDLNKMFIRIWLYSNKKVALKTRTILKKFTQQQVPVWKNIKT